jgi:hypothetical protein
VLCLFERGVICVLCLFVVALPPGKSNLQSNIIANNNNNNNNSNNIDRIFRSVNELLDS